MFIVENVIKADRKMLQQSYEESVYCFEMNYKNVIADLKHESLQPASNLVYTYFQQFVCSLEIVPNPLETRQMVESVLEKQ